ncbi:hypothetical protein OG920_09610 [Streptomyces europaeiscabiei]
MDLLAANQPGRAFFSDMYIGGTTTPIMARFQFLNPATRRFYPGWEPIVDMTVDVLRNEAGGNPHDRDRHDLVGELSARRDAFRTRWCAHSVRRHCTGSQLLPPPARRRPHPLLARHGTARHGTTLLIHTAGPGHPPKEALRLLVSWTASQDGSAPPALW